MSNTITECLLEYYKKLCLRFYLSYSIATTGDMVYQIQDSVMKSSVVYSDEDNGCDFVYEVSIYI